MNGVASTLDPEERGAEAAPAADASRRRLRVLQLVESMEVAGAEQVVLSLVRGLDRSRYEPWVGCLTVEGPLAKECREAGVPVLALGKRAGLDLSVLADLVRTMRRERIDVVHTHVWNADVWGRVAGFLAGVPVRITTYHSVDVWKRRRHLAVDFCLARISNGIVCVSEAVRSFYRSRAGVPESKLRVVLNGIDPSAFEAPVNVAAKRRELGLPAEGPVMIVVARLLPEKGHRYLIEAVSELRRSFPTATLLVVGAGPSREDLDVRARALGLHGSGVRFLGERRDVPELLAASDVFVLPSSIREGLSISLLEAMAARRPVLVTDIGGNRQTVDDGKTGLVVAPADAAALHRGLLELLQDPMRARELAEAGRAKLDREFGAQRMVSDTEALYEQLFREAGVGLSR